MTKFTFVSIFILFCFCVKAQKSGGAVITPTPTVAAKQLKVKGILNNKTGLESCGWVIKLAKRDAHDHEFLEPLNLDKFKLKLSEGKKVEVVYTEENINTTCMVGTVITIKTIKFK